MSRAIWTNHFRRRSRVGRPPIRATWICVVLSCGLSLGCGQDPESLLTTRWEESSWQYEKVDRVPDEVRRFGGIRIGAFEEHTARRHISEYWQFFSDRSFEIGLADGTVTKGRWRMKGRGHILTLRHENGDVEVYDVKLLTEDGLVLHFDLGMELRGIARLEFLRSKDESAQRPRQERTAKNEAPQPS